MDRVGRLGILVEGAGLVLVDSDPDQSPGQVVAACKSVEGLADEIRPNHLALEGDAVGAVTEHDLRWLECSVKSASVSPPPAIRAASHS